MKATFSKCILIVLLFKVFSIQAQTITTSGIGGGPFCAGSTVLVRFTQTGTFSAGNIYTAQLSDAAGSFASPLTIGSLAAVTPDTIYGYIPAATATGTGYRIRVVGSSPVVVGSDNGSNITIRNYSTPTFQKIYETAPGVSTIGNRVIQLKDSTYLLASTGMFLYKADRQGNLQWTKQMYENTTYYKQSYAYSLLNTYDGGFLAGGATIYVSNALGVNNYRLYLIKTDADGNYEWGNTYGDNNDGGTSGTVGSFLSGMKQTADSGYILLGYTSSFGLGAPWKMYLLKIDKQGGYQWSKTFDLTTNNIWHDGDIVVTADGGYMLVGSGAMIKTDANGNVSWAKRINNGGINVSVCATPGGYYIGSMNGFLLVKTDTVGTVLWSKTFSSGYQLSLSPTSDSGCVLSGYEYFNNGQGQPNARVIKVSSDGALQWAKDYGNASEDQASSVVQTWDGGYIVGGCTGNPGNFKYAFLIKTDAQGNSGCNEQSLSLTPANQSYTATNFSPVVTPRSTTMLPPCTNIFNVSTLVNSVCAPGTCNMAQVPYQANSCFVFALSIDNTNNASCHGASDGSATVNITGGSAPFRYNWSNGQTTKTATGLAAGSYTVTVTDNGNVSSSRTVTISQPAPVALTVSPDTAVCAGQSVLLEVSGATSYKWSPAASLSDTVGPSVTASPSVNTSYLITGTSGSCTSTATINISILPLPSSLITSQDSIICSGDSAQLCASGNYSFVWNTGETTPCIFAKAAGGYWVTATEAGGCSTQPPRKQLAVYPVSSVSVVVQGDTLTSFGAVAYQWYKDDVLITGATGTTYIALESAYYTVEITDANGCVARSAPVLAGPVVLEEITKGILNIYPNPFGSVIYIDRPGHIDISSIEVYDIPGQLVLSQTAGLPAAGAVVIDTKALPAGMYLIKVKAAGREVVKRVVKQ